MCSLCVWRWRWRDHQGRQTTRYRHTGGGGGGGGLVLTEHMSQGSNTRLWRRGRKSTKLVYFRRKICTESTSVFTPVLLSLLLLALNLPPIHSIPDVHDLKDTHTQPFLPGFASRKFMLLWVVVVSCTHTCLRLRAAFPT